MMMETWKCPICGKRNDIEDSTCLRCGWDAPIDEACHVDRKALKRIAKTEPKR